jgi:hypothetical protein
MERPTFYAVIPAFVRYAPISAQAKLFYGEITSLCEKEGYCWASNGYFGQLYEADERTVRRWLKELVVAGFVTVDLAANQHGQRRIFLARTEMPGQICPDKNARHNDTSKNNDTRETKKATKRGPTPAIRLEEFLRNSGGGPAGSGFPPAEWGEWANQQFGWDVNRVSNEWADFSDYWTSGNAAGGGLKRDWPATWRGHCRRASLRRGSGSSGRSADVGLAAALRSSVANRYGASQHGQGVSGGTSSGSAQPDAGGTVQPLAPGEIAF